MNTDSPSDALTADSFVDETIENDSRSDDPSWPLKSALWFGLGARLGLAAALLAVSWAALSWAMA